MPRSACRWRWDAQPVAGAASLANGWRRWRGPIAFYIRARMPARSPPPSSRGSPFRFCRSPACAPACASCRRRTDIRTCRVVMSGWCAIRMKAPRSPARWPNTSSRRSITCRKRWSRRSDLLSSPRNAGRGKKLIRIFIVYRIDRTAPLAMEAFEQFFRRRDAARNRFFERAQIARLVAAVTVEKFAPRQSTRGKAQGLLRQRQHVAAADLGGKAEPRHIIAQFLALVRAPTFYHVPTSGERIVIV